MFRSADVIYVVVASSRVSVTLAAIRTSFVYGLPVYTDDLIELLTVVAYFKATTHSSLQP